ncbi:MAG: hypothetical protein PHD39_14695 [Methylobacter tundripaludum]|nr:hypothetical protein [Methylobacter tundripaludum]
MADSMLDSFERKPDAAPAPGRFAACTPPLAITALVPDKPAAYTPSLAI